MRIQRSKIILFISIIIISILIIGSNRIEETNNYYSFVKPKQFLKIENASIPLLANGSPTYTRGTDFGDYVEFDYPGKDNNNTGININTRNTDCQDANFYYEYRGLEPEEMYSITAYVEIDAITTYGTDAGIYMADANNSYSTTKKLKATTEDSWQKITLVAISNNNGTMKIQFGFNNTRANVIFDQIEIQKAEDNNEFKVYSYTNHSGKTAKIAFWKEDTVKYSYTDTVMDSWLSVLLDAREDMKNLTSKEVNNGDVNIIAANYHNWVAYVLGGRIEIQWSRSTVGEIDENGDSPFFILHEMGHQHAIDNSDFDTEFWGTTIALLSAYRMDLKLSGLSINGVGGIRQGQDLIDYCYDGGYQDFIKRSSYAGDGLTYLLFETILTLNEYEEGLGFKSLTETLTYMDTINNPGSNGEKFMTFIKTWSRFSGQDVKSIIYGFREGDSTIIDEEFGIGKFKYNINSDRKSITITSYSRTWEDDLDGTYELVIPETIDGYTVTEIGSWAFANDKHITRLEIPKTITTMRSVAFYSCSNLSTVIIPLDSQLVTLEDWVFNSLSLTEIFIPKTVQNIGEYVLQYGSKKLTINGYSRTAIQEYAKRHNINYNPIDVFNITFNSNGGTECEPVEIIQGDAYGTLPSPRKNGYLFDGWYTQEGQKVESTTEYNLSTDSTLYAGWNIVEYTIVYNLAEGSLEEGQTNPEVYTVEDEDFKLNNPVREGYIFLGWTGSNGAEPQIDVVIKKGSAGNRTYRANWKAICTIDFKDESGQSIEILERPQGDAYGELPKLEKEGYIFVGWFTSQTGGEKVTKDTLVSSDTVLYARWEKISQIITMDITTFNEQEYIIVQENVIESGERGIYTVNDLLTQENFPDTNYTQKVYNSSGEEITQEDAIESGSRLDIYSIDDENEVIKSYNLILKGDLDENGIVNIYDISLAIELRYGLYEREWTDIKKLAGWCLENNQRENGIPNIYDITRLIEYNFNDKNW